MLPTMADQLFAHLLRGSLDLSSDTKTTFFPPETFTWNPILQTTVVVDAAVSK